MENSGLSPVEELERASLGRWMQKECACWLSQTVARLVGDDEGPVKTQVSTLTIKHLPQSRLYKTPHPPLESKLGAI